MCGHDTTDGQTDRRKASCGNNCASKKEAKQTKTT